MTIAKSYNEDIVHIDADAFYASVEQNDNPELKGKPVIIGHDPKSRGIVSTCSYEARAYGVHSAMPAFRAYRLCPNGVFVKPRMKRYEEVSQDMFRIFNKYSPIVEKLSIDEAFIDTSGENSAEVATSIRKHVKRKLGITVSAGVSYCKFLAKLASDSCKPDGLMCISKNEALDFLDDRSVSCLPGIGPKTLAKLNAQGITNIKSLRKMPRNWFYKMFGKNATRFYHMANGEDDEPVVPSRQVKSISEETTFRHDIIDIDTLKTQLAVLSQNVAFRVRKAQFKCKTLGIKIRYNDFSTITREFTMPKSISSDAEIFGQAKRLLEKVSPRKPVRLLGVVAKSLILENTGQISLFKQPDIQWDNVSRSLDMLRNKYGKPVVFLGASLNTKRQS